MSTLWLIPARGGSKGIPDKNIKPFCGKSLVGRAVAQALECASQCDTVFVSTDSEAIKKEAEREGIEVPFMRPPEHASDTAGTYGVIMHSLEQFRCLGKEFEKVVLLQPTSPLRTVEDIRGTMNLWTPELDMAVSVTQSKANPYFNLFETDAEGYLKISKGKGKFSRRQDAPKVWEYNGAVYVISVQALMRSPMAEFKKVKGYEMHPLRSVDLDTPQDWEIAEFLFEKRQKNEG